MSLPLSQSSFSLCAYFGQRKYDEGGWGEFNAYELRPILQIHVIEYVNTDPDLQDTGFLGTKN